MAFEHVIRNHDGNLIEATLTPKKAVRLHCLECVGSSRDVKSCGGHHDLSTGEPCEFYPYRLGKGRPSVKLIRKFCLSCLGTSNLVADCSSEACSLWPYRFGHRPTPTLVENNRPRHDYPNKAQSQHPTLGNPLG